MIKTHNIEHRGMLKYGLVAALIATMSISVLVSTTSTSTAGAKNIKNSSNMKYTKVSKNAKKRLSDEGIGDNWGYQCNNYGPPGSVNWHGYDEPKECFDDTYNPFATIYDNYDKK